MRFYENSMRSYTGGNVSMGVGGAQLNCLESQKLLPFADHQASAAIYSRLLLWRTQTWVQPPGIHLAVFVFHFKAAALIIIWS